MRRIVVIFPKMCVLLAAVLLLAACAPNASNAPALPETIEMDYFYDEICGSCDGTEDFDAIVAEKLAGVREATGYDYTITRTNLYDEGGQARFDELCASLELDAAGLQLPVLVIGGKAYQGLEAIETNLLEATLTAGEDLYTHSTVYSPAEKKTGEHLFDDYKVSPDSLVVVYFYRTVCEECQETEPVIDGLPDTVTIDGKQVPVELVRINTRSGNNGERITAFFDAWQVPDDDRMVPIVFTKAGYLAGIDNITAGLPGMLADGENAGFTFPTGAVQ